MFDHLSPESWSWSDADRALANLMATCWTNFAKSGDPSGDGVPVWPNFTTDKERVLHFDKSATEGRVPNLEWLGRLDVRYMGLRGPTNALAR